MMMLAIKGNSGKMKKSKWITGKNKRGFVRKKRDI